MTSTSTSTPATACGSRRPALPLRCVYVELTNACNFTCEYCPNRVMSRPKGQMKAVLLRAALEQIAHCRIAPLVVFQQQGEPLLYGGLGEAVHAASRLGLATCVTTNGSMLTYEALDALVAAGLSRLVVSVQAPDATGFAERGPSNLAFDDYRSRVVRGVCRSLAAPAPPAVTLSFLTRAHWGLTTPTTGRSWRLVSRNAELRRTVTSWVAAVLGCDAAAVIERVPALARLSVHRHEELAVAPGLTLESRPAGEWATPPHLPGARWFGARFGRCHRSGLQEHFAVLWDGQYAFCCDDYDGRTARARFPATPMLEFLSSAPVQAALGGFARARPVNPYCKLCLGGTTRSYALAHSIGSLGWARRAKRPCCTMGEPPAAPARAAQKA